MRDNQKPNIVLIVLDSARAQSFSCYGSNLETSPNIDRIAKQGMLFRNAYSPASWTVPAHISMFNGEYWSKHKEGHKKRFIKKSPFISLLKKENYKTFIFSSNWLLQPYGLLDWFDYAYYHNLWKIWEWFITTMELMNL